MIDQSQNIEDRGRFLTEQSNLKSNNIDQLSTLDLVQLFNEEDKNWKLLAEK